MGVLAKLGKMDAHLGKETLNARRGSWAPGQPWTDQLKMKKDDAKTDPFSSEP